MKNARYDEIYAEYVLETLEKAKNSTIEAIDDREAELLEQLENGEIEFEEYAKYVDDFIKD